MLPSDVKDRKAKAMCTQQAINSHFTEHKFAECVVPYSNKLFKIAAVEWLIATDQVSVLLDQSLLLIFAC
jgi:hypothetical protein